MSQTGHLGHKKFSLLCVSLLLLCVGKVPFGKLAFMFQRRGEVSKGDLDLSPPICLLKSLTFSFFRDFPDFFGDFPDMSISSFSVY